MKKVLLVDDANLLLDVEKTLLNRPGIELFTARDGKEALDIHRKEKVDFILLDLNLQGDISSDEVCKCVRSDDELKKASIVMVTTNSTQNDIERCFNSGANDYVAKPINPAELLQKLQVYMYVAIRQDLRILVKLSIEGRNGLESFFGNTVNLSNSGSLIECARLMHVGDMISCAFSLPGNTIPLSISGEVIRQANGHGTGMKAYGIKFLDILEEDQRVIKSFIARNQPNSV